MNSKMVNEIVEAVLYEGHILYPYRASSKKNKQRFTFGRVYPEPYSVSQKGREPCMMQTEVLLRAEKSASLEICVRFLHPLWREIGLLTAPICEWPASGEPDFELVPKAQINGRDYQAWQETMEREVVVPGIALSERSIETPFAFPATRTLEPIRDEKNQIAGVIVRTQKSVAGSLQTDVVPVAEDVFKITARVFNRTPLENPALAENEIVMQTFISTHLVFQASGGEFISLLDPPEEFQSAAKICKNVGAWPVLVGNEEKAERDTMLASPIILYDYPKIAPESAGNFFDGTEIDEMLSLRVMTMTEEEKKEMRAVDEQARRLLERTTYLPENDLLRMHGTIRQPRSFDEMIFGGSSRLEGVPFGKAFLREGDRVRIRPRRRADIMDMALDGKIGVIQAFEQDAEGKVHLALVMEDDPGKDLGIMRQSGHRFFYGLDEIELV